MSKRRVVLYARLSVTTEESVSIERQLEAGRKYADSRGWTVVAEAVDDGVSATKNKPEERTGWRSILNLPERFDAVVVWKVDRLARRVLDFLHADEALRERGAGLVAVEDPIDMTTAQGRAFATMLAVFAEMEAASISARVTAARRAIVHAGRRAGGRPPLGYMNVPNPDGPGVVLAKDPDWIGVVATLAGRALRGESLYSLARWLEAEGIAPRTRNGRKNGHWHEASVEAVLRNPSLAGMVPYRGDVVRDQDGLPVVDESLAILTTEERRLLLASLDGAKRPGSRPKAGSEPCLLYGLARCGTCGGLMYRATAAGGRYRYYRCDQHGCPRQVSISRESLEEYVTSEFLRILGRFSAVEVEELASDPAPRLADIEAAISDTLAQMADDDADVVVLAERLTNLKALRAEARTDEASAPEVRFHETGATFAEAWEGTDDIEARRQLLLSALVAVTVAPTERRGNTFDPERVTMEWRA